VIGSALATGISIDIFSTLSEKHEFLVPTAILWNRQCLTAQLQNCRLHAMISMIVPLLALLVWGSLGSLNANTDYRVVIPDREESLIAFNDWGDQSSDHQLSRKQQLLIKIPSGEPKIISTQAIHKNAEPAPECNHIRRCLVAMESNTGCRAPPIKC